MLATLLRPEAGTARVFGHDVVTEADDLSSRVSVTGQFAPVDEDLSGRENLTLLGWLRGHEEAQSAGAIRWAGGPERRAPGTPG